MQNVFDIEPSTTILRESPYLLSYPHLVEFFANKQIISQGDVVCGAHMVYGWMPKVLKLHLSSKDIDLVRAAELLNSAKTDGCLTTTQLEELVGLVNNSLVGVSKLLHFVAPASFPIWDSKVCSFVYEEQPRPCRINDVTNYLGYINLLKKLTDDARFANFYSSVKGKIGYEVTPFRALELIMFLRAPDYRICCWR